MRGGDEQTGELVSYVNLEKRVRPDHPLRAIRGLVNDAGRAGAGVRGAVCADRRSIPPEKLLRVMLLQAFYAIRSERQLMERLEFETGRRIFHSAKRRRQQNWGIAYRSLAIASVEFLPCQLLHARGAVDPD